MTDDEILTTIDRRLAEVEERLPPRTLDPAASSRPVGGRPVAGRLGGGAWPGLVVVAVVAVVVVGLGVAGRPDGATRGVADMSSSPPTSSPVPIASPVATYRPTPTPYDTSYVDGLEILRGDADASEMMLVRLGWSVVGACVRSGFVMRRGLDGIAIDAAATEAGISEGWLDVPGTGRVFIGPSAERAAVARGATILAQGGRDTMAILLDGTVFDWVGWPTVGGNTVWLTGGSNRRFPCPSEVEVSPTPTVEGLEVLRTDGSAERLILDRLGISKPGQCLMGADILISLPDLAALDALAEARGIDEGWVDVPGFGQVLIGPSGERASRALDASILAVGSGGDMWVAVGASARQLVAFSTPAGRTYWRLTSMVRPCSPEPGDPR